MTDDLHPDLELASRALDDDVTADERARVTASPDLTALVASLRDTREALAEVPPAPADAREAALRAALAAFDELQAPATAAPAPATRSTGGVVALFRRRTSLIMAAAAAVLLVGVVGTLALRSGSDDSASVATDPGEEILRSASGTDAAADSGGADTAMTEAAPQSTIPRIDGPAVASYVVSDPADLLALADALAPMKVTTAGGAETMPASADASVPDDGGNPAGAVPAPGFDCPLEPDQVAFAPILWQDVPAMAVRNTTTGVVQAISDDCTILVTVGP